MGRGAVRLPRDGHGWLDIFSAARRGASGERIRFTPEQIAQIARAVRGTPEVMVKVTGGGTSAGAVAAHISYIGRYGALEIETDEGERIRGRKEQRALLEDWHLDLSPGQYRQQRNGEKAKRPVKLVHNIVLSMPAPTPPDKVLAAARDFARERFRGKHRYAMVLHTDQKHPHVHIVVKSESLQGPRLHVDKPMLRAWREDFAQKLREQGLAANATPSVYRDRRGPRPRDAAYRAQRYGHSTTLRAEVESVAGEFQAAGHIVVPTRTKPAETRKAVVAQWEEVAGILDNQGELVLSGEVRNFSRRLPRLRTRREKLAVLLLEHMHSRVAEMAQRESKPAQRESPTR